MTVYIVLRSFAGSSLRFGLDALGLYNESNDGQVADAWESGVKVVWICAVVQIFENVVYNIPSSVSYNMKSSLYQFGRRLDGIL